MELTDWTDILAEAGVTKETVHEKRRDEITSNYPRRQPGAIPETKRFVGPQIETDQNDGEPFTPQRSRPIQFGWHHSSADVADKGERTSHAKEISEDQKR